MHNQRVGLYSHGDQPLGFRRGEAEELGHCLFLVHYCRMAFIFFTIKDREAKIQFFFEKKIEKKRVLTV
jgi:hypothetical protein